jgi:hypothetical protein
VTVAEEVPVVKYVKNLMVKIAKNKPQELKAPETMKAGDFLKVVKAIEEETKIAGHMKEPATDPTEKLSVSFADKFFED